MELIAAEPNVMQVFELLETPEPAIIMTYYPLGNIANAGIVDEERYISAFGQVLDGLSHLHAKGVVHRDLKPENFVIEMKPLFKVIITDFGLAKVATDKALLRTFCGSLNYAAPEVFPSLGSGHGPPVDVWSLGVIVFEWVWGIPNPPDVPKAKKGNGEVSAESWHDWVETWAELLLNRLEDQENDQLVRILDRMIEIKVKKRWPAIRCLAQGFRGGLFKRRMADGLVVYASDPDDLDLPAEEGEDETKTPTAGSPPGSGPSRSVASMLSANSNPGATTMILGNMWGTGGSTNSP